ncbi:MAG TPA: FAD binding domain-containing protein [Conexibacter sp.]|nr:FAD binding domain-containing protein [Conexibacter sp.]
MRPASFDYLAATSVEEVCAALAQDPAGTRVLAGGQSLMPRLVRRLERPRRLLDVNGIAELGRLRADAGGLTFGAAVTQRSGELAAELRGFGVLSQALPRVGKVTTRNRGTVCGSIAHANPAAELGVCLLAMGGELRAVSARGSRTLAPQEFFLAPFRTALRDDELLSEVTFARPGAATIGHFDEVTLRGAGDTPLASVAVVCETAAGAVARTRIAVGSAGQAPSLASDALAARLRGPLGDAEIDAAAAELGETLELAGDVHGSADHRRRLVVALVARLLRRVREQL